MFKRKKAGIIPDIIYNDLVALNIFDPSRSAMIVPSSTSECQPVSKVKFERRSLDGSD